MRKARRRFSSTWRSERIALTAASALGVWREDADVARAFAGGVRPGRPELEAACKSCGVLIIAVGSEKKSPTV